MRLLLGVLFVVMIVGSFYADYRWKKWIAGKRVEREHRDFNRRS